MKHILCIFAKCIFLIISSESIKLGKTYQHRWEKDCHWIKSVEGYKAKAYCIVVSHKLTPIVKDLCILRKKTFNISNICKHVNVQNMCVYMCLCMWICTCILRFIPTFIIFVDIRNTAFVDTYRKLSLILSQHHYMQ